MQASRKLKYVLAERNVAWLELSKRVPQLLGLQGEMAACHAVRGSCIKAQISLQMLNRVTSVCKAGDEKILRSKLNLVDLAGSERITRSRPDGVILREAKFINLSLHYLEQVIIALQVCSIYSKTSKPARIQLLSCKTLISCIHVSNASYLLVQRY